MAMGSPRSSGGRKRFIVGIVIVAALLSLPFALSMSRETPGWSGASDSVALINLVGTIETLSDSVVSDGGGVGSVIDALNNARKNNRISAVVLRINSGGGSAAASQEVHRAVLKVREADKPVVVSMADVAASGGYYIAVAADRILANPSTITGSIGVLSQFLNLSELSDKYGVKLETVKTGPYKDMGNPTKPFTEDERRVMQSVVDDSLDQFVAAIADGRNMEPERVRELADGRIYTGNQARELGLIDDFGGLEDAINLAAELAGIEGKPNIIRYDRPRGRLWRALGVLSSGIVDSSNFIDDYLLKRLVNERPTLTLRY